VIYVLVLPYTDKNGKNQFTNKYNFHLQRSLVITSIGMKNITTTGKILNEPQRAQSTQRRRKKNFNNDL
jgi:hypothetical protein